MHVAFGRVRRKTSPTNQKGVMSLQAIEMSSYFCTYANS